MTILKKRSSVLVLLLCLAMAFTFAACGNDDEPTEEPANNEPTQEQPEEENNDPVEATIEDYNVKLYYANMEYIESGDEALDKLVGPFDATLEQVEVGRQYYELLMAMEDVGGRDNAYTSLMPDRPLNDVYFEDGTVYVDYTQLDGGSLDETLMIDQIVASLTESFPEVEAVQFLINGETADTLMGHVSIADPFTRNESAEARVSEAPEGEEDR